MKEVSTMKKLLSLLSILTTSGTAPLIESSCSCSCSNKNNNNDEIKILKRYINNTILENTKNSEIKILSAEIEKKWNELLKKEHEYKINFETNHKNIDFQLFILFSLKKEEAFFKMIELKYAKKIPPKENISTISLKTLIKQIKKGFFYIKEKEYKINNLIVKLASELEKKYFL